MDDVEHMRRAMALADTVRVSTAPNPWVGSVVVPTSADATTAEPSVFEGATAPPGGPHAEVTALAQAGQAAVAPRSTPRSSRAPTKGGRHLASTPSSKRE